MENLATIKDFLKQAISFQDLDNISSKIKYCWQDSSLSLQEKQDLAKIRQRIYEKKHKLKLDRPKEMAINTNKEIKSDSKDEESKNIVLDSKIEYTNRLDKNNIVFVIKLILLFACNIFFAFITWQQTCILYDALGFDNAQFIAISGLGMSTLPILFLNNSNKKIIYFLLLLVFIYEISLVIFSTFTNENKTIALEISKDAKYYYLLENHNKHKQEYESIKFKFHNPTSKMYLNKWYKKNYLDTAFEQVRISLDQLSEYEKSFQNKIDNNTKKILKIFFRILLFFFLALCTKQLLFILNIRIPSK